MAVLDSGVAPHADLDGRVLAFHDFTGKGWGAGERQYRHTPYDEYGHGTHICGILCGSGRLSGGRYRGICPWGRLVVGKVLDSRGEGSTEDMLAGMEWVLSLKDRYRIRILNISVGIDDMKDEEKEESLQRAMEHLYQEGILVVCAAGNKGPATASISPLAAGEHVIGVGCHDGAYYRGCRGRCELYSGRGKMYGVPRKPDIVAPGTGIVCCSPGGQYGSYQERSGTSMAAPIVTGCLGLALHQDPSLTPKGLCHLLTHTAWDLGEPWNKQGWGMVNPMGMLREIVKERNL